MPTTRVFTIEGGSVSDGATEELSEADDEAWTIEEVQVVEESGSDLPASTATISIQGDSVTDQNVPIATLQESYSDLPPMDLEWPRNTRFEFSWTNSSGGSATVNVVLWVTPASGSGG
jgi:hypothetical protein